MRVPGRGLEPPPPFGDYTLNVARLPISPSGLFYFTNITFFINTKFNLILKYISKINYIVINCSAYILKIYSFELR